MNTRGTLPTKGNGAYKGNKRHDDRGTHAATYPSSRVVDHGFTRDDANRCTPDNHGRSVGAGTRPRGYRLSLCRCIWRAGTGR